MAATIGTARTGKELPGLARLGIEGLDDVLAGGLPRNRLYLVQGDPGVGKTTLGLHFLMEGTAHGETGLYITLSETREELQAVAASHGWHLDDVQLYELASAGDFSETDNTLFHPDEVELHEATRTLLAEVERVRPSRVVFDSLSEIRLLAQSPLRYRRQILALKQYFSGRKCTVLLLDDRSAQTGDAQVESLAHGVIELEQRAPEYGTDRRRLRVRKLRGVRYRGGYHDFLIRKGGLDVFPRLVAAEHKEAFETGLSSTGLPALDTLLGGGLDKGTATLVIGPAGCGKSALATQYALAAAARGDRTALFLFDEREHTMFTRAASLGMDVRGAVEAGSILVRQVDPAELSPGEFTAKVREAVDRDGVRVVIIDSLNGYHQAMPEERFLSIQMHELLTFLGQRGVVTLLIMAQHGLVGAPQAPVDLSYLADTVILLRYFEAQGAIHKAISVIKKRSGPHEATIREYAMEGGLWIGEPLTHFRGILTGLPHSTATSDG